MNQAGKAKRQSQCRRTLAQALASLALGWALLASAHAQTNATARSAKPLLASRTTPKTASPLPAYLTVLSQNETNATNTVPFALTLPPAERMFAAQLALARLGLSPGSIDGFPGPKTTAALKVFQSREGLRATGELDTNTLVRLIAEEPVLSDYVITQEDLLRLRPLERTWLGKSQQDRLDYETVLEMLAERHQASPKFLIRLNPTVDWTNVVAGTSVKVPKVASPSLPAKAAFVRIRLSDCLLQAFDGETNLLAHFPCSIARNVEKRPAGELHIANIAANPNYTFNPEIFPESQEGRELGRKLILPPGPNNPVGTVWIGLDAPGFGIHGTPRPEDVGRAETHGCFRLANWNAELLLQLVSVGTPVLIE